MGTIKEASHLKIIHNFHEGTYLFIKVSMELCEIGISDDFYLSINKLWNFPNKINLLERYPKVNKLYSSIVYGNFKLVQELLSSGNDPRNHNYQSYFLCL